MLIIETKLPRLLGAIARSAIATATITSLGVFLVVALPLATGAAPPLSLGFETLRQCTFRSGFCNTTHTRKLFTLQSFCSSTSNNFVSHLTLIFELSVSSRVCIPYSISFTHLPASSAWCSTSSAPRLAPASSRAAATAEFTRFQWYQTAKNREPTRASRTGNLGVLALLLLDIQKLSKFRRPHVTCIFSRKSYPCVSQLPQANPGSFLPLTLIGTSLPQLP